MNGFICHEDRVPAQALRVLVQLASCCLGAAEYGADHCTCWEPEYDLEQAPVAVGGPGQRTSMCADCAYRPDSPERSGDDRYSHASGELLDLQEPFWCHSGMRKPIRWRHPAGITVEVDTDAYQPPVVAGVPYKADGSPGDRCAGWTAHRRAEAHLLDEVIHGG